MTETRFAASESSSVQGAAAPGAWALKLQRVERLARRFVTAIAAFGLVLWASGMQYAVSIGGQSPIMQRGSVVALGLAVISLRALALDSGRRRRWFVLVPSGLLILLAAGALALNLGVLREPQFLVAGLSTLFDPVRTVVGTPSCYLLLGISMVLALGGAQRSREGSQFLAAAVAGIALVALVGLTVRLVRVDVEVPSLAIPWLVALALLSASFSLLAMRPASRLVQLLEHDSPGALVVRRLVPMAIGLPLVVVWVKALGLRSGWFHTAESEGVLTVATIIGAVGFILWVSNRLDEMNLSRSRAEHRADTERQWLEVTLANIGDAVLTVNDEGRVSFLNPAAEALIGVPASSAVGEMVSHLVTLVDGASGEPLACPLESAFELAHSVSLKGEPALRRRDGTLQDVDVTATPIKDDHQRVVGGVLVLRDVSAGRAREHAEREAYAALDRRVAERTRALDRTMSVLRESTTLLVTIAASTPELIVAKSRDGHIMMINPAALQAMGLSRAQIIGRKEEEIFGDTEDTRRAAENDRRVIETGRPVVVEERRTVRSETRIYLVTKSPLRNAEGQVFGLVGVAKDITERKRAQQDLEQLLIAEHRLRGEAERANRAKDEFLAIVSHELRSPLNALKGWSQVLISAKNPDPALVARAADAIKRNIDHQTRLIDDLLDTSRIISGKLELHLHRVNLVDVVNTALDLSRDSVRAKRLELSFVCVDDEVYVDGDFDRLQQVLSNLLSNAIKFTPEGGAVLVRLLQTDKCVELSVADSGIGIDADFLPHVFDRFSQADTSMTRRYLGLGIGLALVRNLVELHDGTVQATSAGTDKGSIFTVILPRAREQKGQGVPRRVSGTKVPGPSLAGITAYLVDDDPDAREVMRLILSGAGAQVRAFDSGEHLLEEWDAAPELPEPAVLLLDIAMPGDSGFDILKRIRLSGRTPEVPPIAVTALTHLDDDQFAAAGFKGKVGKPVDEATLLKMIAQVISRDGNGEEVRSASPAQPAER